MAAAEALRAYFHQLSENPSVQADLDRSLRNARAAYSRARQAKDIKRAAADRGVRARARQSFDSARSAVQEIKRGPEIERRRRRREPVLIVAAALAGAVAAALYPDLQSQLSRQSSTEQS